MTRSVEESHRRHAVIDIGSNSVLLLVMQTDGIVVCDRSHITRLSQGVFERGVLDPGAVERTHAVIATLAEEARQLGARRVVAVGTEALRRARDGAEFLARLEREGVVDDARCLDGEEEAALTLEASRRALPVPGEALAVVDVGGGSTEIAWQRAGRVSGISLPLGSVRLTEALVGADPIVASDLERLREHIATALEAVPADRDGPAGAPLVAVAGTATTLAALDLALDPYDPDAVEGYPVDRTRLEDWSRRLAALDVPARCALPGMEAGRADVIVAGLEILAASARRLGARSLRVSGRGVRHGVALQLAATEGLSGRSG